MTGSLQVKKDTYYMVLNLYDKSGKRKQKWISIDLPVKGNRKRAEKLLREALNAYEMQQIKPTCDLAMRYVCGLKKPLSGWMK